MYDFEVSREDAQGAEDAARDFYNYSLELLNDRRTNPKDDMITRLSQVSENNVYLTDQQIICTIILLLNAGHEATVNTLGNGLRALLSNNIDFDEIKNKDIPTKDVVEDFLEKGKPLFLELDVKGALNLKKLYPNDTFSIFLSVPINELENRLINRSSESKDEIKKRLSRFDQEESLKKEFDYTLINDNFETTFEELKNTVLKRIKNGN